MGFEVGMRLEVVDIKNPQLIRPAHIVECSDNDIKVLFDGWSKEYGFWTEDDNPDIHPINWCQRTKHPLELLPQRKL